MAGDLFDLMQRELVALQQSHRDSLADMETLHRQRLDRLEQQQADKLQVVSDAAGQIRGEVAKFEGQISRAHELTRNLDVTMWRNSGPAFLWLTYFLLVAAFGAIAGVWWISDTKIEEGRQIGFQEGKRAAVVWAFENPKDFAKMKADWQEQQRKGQGAR